MYLIIGPNWEHQPITINPQLVQLTLKTCVRSVTVCKLLIKKVSVMVTHIKARLVCCFVFFFLKVTVVLAADLYIEQLYDANDCAWFCQCVSVHAN